MRAYLNVLLLSSPYIILISGLRVVLREVSLNTVAEWCKTNVDGFNNILLH